MSKVLHWLTRSQQFTRLAFALALAWRASAPAQTLPPALMVEQNNHSSPLAISKVDVDVRILGFIAETCMTLTFRNDLSRPLAGDLYFPLPVGATISGYALDVKGDMVDGVVVDKDKGRQVFEKEVRKGVDPGLVEWTRGNHFKTRVFPIPAHGTRTVRVSYLSEIGTDAQGSHYQLPLAFKEPLRDFHLRLEVVKAEAKPVSHQGTPVALQFSKWRDSFVAEARQTNAPAAGEITIDLPQVERQRLLVERASDGQCYFCLNEFPADPRPAQKKPMLPGPEPSDHLLGCLGLARRHRSSARAGLAQELVRGLLQVFPHSKPGAVSQCVGAGAAVHGHQRRPVRAAHCHRAASL